MYDTSTTHISQHISAPFQLSPVVHSFDTYTLGIYPVMKDYLMHMQALNLQNRTFAILENGSWAPKSGALMTQFVEEHLKNSEVLETQVSMASALNEGKAAEMDAMADAILESMKVK